jgi:hypothetical protein
MKTNLTFLLEEELLMGNRKSSLHSHLGRPVTSAVFSALRTMASFVALGVSATHGQINTAEVAGTVKDVRGAVLAGALVTALNNGSGLKVDRATDNAGRFLFPSLSPGEYTLTVEASGFKRSIHKGIVLEIGQIMKMDIVMEIGNITDEVNVVAGEPLLKTATAEISDVIENRRIVDLPLNGRQFLQLALLSEGVIKPPGGTRGAALQQAGDLVNVAGQRSGHNIYLLDGVKVTDEYFNNLVISPSIDAIQEFKIQKSMYSPEFGGKASALINVATKSGTNDYHGTLFEFVRNDIFDAKNFFDDPRKPIPPFRQNQFGGVLGGPISIPGVYDGKGKSFFFISYEGQRIRKSLTQTFSVPTAAVRAGDFSGFGGLPAPDQFLQRAASILAEWQLVDVKVHLRSRRLKAARRKQIACRKSPHHGVFAKALSSRQSFVGSRLYEQKHPNGRQHGGDFG